MTFGERLKQLRDEHDLTQKELGEALGTHQSRIATWESPESVGPKIPMLFRIADFFGLTIGELLEPMRSERAGPEDQDAA